MDVDGAASNRGTPASDFGPRQGLLTNQRLWEAVPSIECPTLVVRGALSDVFWDEDAEKLARALPNGRRVLIEGAGHTVQGDNPKVLVKALGHFFGEIGVA